MPELLTHCGSELCKLEQPLSIPEPEQTETYTPLNHYDFAINVKTVASNMLRDFTFAKEAYALSSNGSKMFGVLSCSSKSTSDDDPLRLSIDIRNSHCKTFRSAVAVGTSVIVCDNLMFRGDSTVMRKHTGEHMLEELMEQVVTAIYESEHQYSQLCFDAARMIKIALDQRASYEYLGMLRLTITFLIIAIIAAIFGFGGIAGAAAGIAEILLYVFIVLFLLSLIFGRGRV